MTVKFILLETFKRGASVNSSRFAEEQGVSRAGVHKLLQGLQADGLITSSGDRLHRMWKAVDPERINLDTAEEEIRVLGGKPPPPMTQEVADLQNVFGIRAANVEGLPARRFSRFGSKA